MELRSRKIGVSNENQSNSYPGYKIIKNVYAWKPKDNIFLSFCRDSDIHGVKYIGYLTTHIFERIFWIAMLTVSAYFAFSGMQDIIANYNESPMLVSYQPEELSLEQIPFPAITVCNNNVLRASAINSMNDQLKSTDALLVEETQSALQLALHYCRAFAMSFSTFFNYSVPEDEFTGKMPLYSEDYYEKDYLANFSHKTLSLIHTARQPCSDMILKCLWSNTVKDCNDLFHPIATDFGVCCQFNGIPEELMLHGRKVFLNPHTPELERQKRNESVMRWIKWINEDKLVRNERDESGAMLDADSDLPPMRQRKAGRDAALTFLLNPELEQYTCELQDGAGFSLLADSPLDYPKVTGFGIGIQPNTENFVDIVPELTISDKNINDVPVDLRQCYFKGEMTLKFYSQYTVENCRSECFANITLAACNCVRIYMAKDNTTKICGSNKSHCVSKVFAQSRREGMKNLKKNCTLCLPRCTNINYLAASTVLPMNPFRNPWVKKGEKAFWADKNTSIVHVYFGSDSVHSKLRRRMYDESDLIANTGGLLGLYLGFSFMTILEIVYHFLFRTLFERTEDGNYVIAQKLKTLTEKMRAKSSKNDNTDTFKRMYIQSDMTRGNPYCANGEIIF